MSEAIKNELIRQMEMQTEDMTPSSIQREKGLVWLEGWFDLDKALQQDKLRDAAENLVIGIGMGWDLDGLVDAVRGEINSL